MQVRFGAILAVVMSLALGACAAGTPSPAATPSPGGTPPRADSARYPHTDADVHFMTAMIGHHAQAIEMARLAESRAGSAQVRTLAARILNAQRDEIATMQRWLRDRGRPAPTVDSTGTVTGGGAHGGHHAAMPGMLTPAQLRELAGARGREFDRLFLTFMIQHHRGAVAMVHELFATPGAGQDDTVFKLASDVQVDQATEIARMEGMLAALMFEPA